MSNKTNLTPTLEDVARLSGVSTATVSRCLNAPDRVVEATRIRVLAAVKELGYKPNFGAKLMAAGRSNTIGAIIPTMENATFAQGLQAFEDALHAAGFTLLVASSNFDLDKEADQIRTLIARGADGLLLIGLDRQPDIQRHLQELGLPVVTAWTHATDAPFCTIGFDNTMAMYDLAKQVLAQGHKRLGLVTAQTKNNDRARQRLNGVHQALEEHGLPPSSLQIIQTEYNINLGAQAFVKMMKGIDPPTVVMCGNDVLAAGALKAAKSMRLRVPEDVSVTGFDDTTLADALSPELTTVHVPHSAMGQAAAKALLDQMSEGISMKSRRLATKVVMRQTLGPAPDHMV